MSSTPEWYILFTTQFDLHINGWFHFVYIILMAGALDGYGGAGANDGQVAVFFHHHNGLILPDFSDRSDGISQMDFSKLIRWVLYCWISIQC